MLGLVLAVLPGGAIDAAAASAATQQAGAAWRAFAVFHGLDRRYGAELAQSPAAAGPLPGLKDRDVYLIFIESYGTVALDDPAYRASIEPALAAFAADAAQGGYRLLSSRLVSPVYGGGSWLAHGTLASGLKLDPVLNELLLHSGRPGLPRYLAAAGYRTVEVMPGIKQPDPDAAFWGFDQHYFAAQLGYRGPPFGWFDIPDQYTLQQFSARELGPRANATGTRPLFAQIVLVSSHTPFTPVPPYVADWTDVPRYAGIAQPEWNRIYAPPDWHNLDPDYLASIAYDLRTLGAWLGRLDRDALIIMLGDHQPPALTRGAGQPWTVPVYVLSRDADLVAPFAALGYAPGDEPPPRAHPEGMERFLGEFLNAFGRPSPAPAAALQQIPPAPASSRP